MHTRLYKESLSLHTDFYQITMAYAYWKSGKAEQEAIFHLYFRKHPFHGGFTVACGLEDVIDYLQHFSFTDADINYLAGLTGNDGKPLFEEAFLEFLKNSRFTCDLMAVPEGSVVFPNEPLLRIQGPLWQCQILETPLLNIMNFQTLIATKAARIRLAAKEDPVLEFGLRRAQGIDGGFSASRAAYIGGCDGTSNVLAGKLLGIPVKGTHAHSWVMSFDSEEEAFQAYAQAMPNNCILLVDTYNTLEGVKKAIRVGQQLRARGYELAGIRLDSGDLAYLSIEARKLLDEAGFRQTKIVASNDLDEHIVESLKQQGARIDIWGIGTKLVTAFDQPALGGVYKIAALKNPETGDWEYKIKLSEQSIKVSVPGKLQVKRFYDASRGLYVGDMIYNELSPPEGNHFTIVDPQDPIRRKRLSSDVFESKDLLIPVFEKGKAVYSLPDLEHIRRHRQEELDKLHGSIKRFVNPHLYPAGLEKGLYRLREDLIEKLRPA